MVVWGVQQWFSYTLTHTHTHTHTHISAPSGNLVCYSVWSRVPCACYREEQNLAPCWICLFNLYLILFTKRIPVQFSSVTQSCPALCDPMDCSTPSLPVHHQLPESTQTHVHWVGDAIQPSHPLLSPSPLAFDLFQHQGLFKWVSSSHQVARVLEFQLQHQSFQWTFRTDFL